MAQSQPTEEIDEKMMEHGYYEVYVTVSAPEYNGVPVNLTIDIYGDEELLKDINPNLEDAVVNYGMSDIDKMSSFERTIGRYLGDMLDNKCIMDAYCDAFDIESVKDLEEKLENDTIRVFTL